MKANKLLLLIDDYKDINAYQNIGIISFSFALKDFSVGVNNSYSLEEIESFGVNCYIIINKLLDSNDIDYLKNVKLPGNIIGVITEDYGLINVFSTIEVIVYNMHYLTNYNSINILLKDFTSTFVSTDITDEEIIDIFKNANKELVLYLFGYNNIMYSKRKLLTNYNKNYGKSVENNSVITAINNNTKFKVCENYYGTVYLSNNIYSSKRIMNKIDNVKYYFINTMFINKDEVIRFITTDYNEYDEGFLNKKTFFNLKGDNHE